MVTNLVGNALKFTPRGGSVSVQVRDWGAEIELRVTDTGEGIAADALPRIFDPYRQAHAGRNGSGLGLAVVKGFVEAHGGRVDVESEVGTGAAYSSSRSPGDGARHEPGADRSRARPRGRRRKRLREVFPGTGPRCPGSAEAPSRRRQDAPVGERRPGRATTPIPSATVEQGFELGRGGKPLAARDLYERVVRDYPDDPACAGALFGLGLLYADPTSPLRDYRVSYATFGRLLAEHPRSRWDADARLWRATLQELLAREEETVRLRSQLQRLKRIEVDLDRPR